MLESDLIFEDRMIQELVANKNKDVALVAKYEQWMDGTVVTIDSKNRITEFIEKKDFRFDRIDEYYKTVNIYKLSKEFSKNQYIPFLEAYMKAYGINEYYELALKAIAHLSRSTLKALPIGDIKWYEIDDAQDYDIVNCLFSKPEDTIKMYQKRFGGYWRFNNIKDYCYLVNPYFPPQNMINKMMYLSKELISSYPSGLNIQNINAGRLFGIDETEILVGNGAAELINVLGHLLKGKMALSIPAFNEYERCFKSCQIIELDSKTNGYKLDPNKILEIIDTVDSIAIINPDNPSGDFIKFDDMMKIIEKADTQNKKIIVDESFIDFADADVRYTLLNSKILERYKNLIVIKSIGKSYGVPGIRLGILASGNKELLSAIRDEMAIWNINAFGEYYLQIATLYTKEYKKSCELIAKERSSFISKLKQIPYIKPYESQANYIMCRLEGRNSTALANYLLKNYSILIKDLKNKKGFENVDFIRLAVKSTKDNDELIEALKGFN